MAIIDDFKKKKVKNVDTKKHKPKLKFLKKKRKGKKGKRKAYKSGTFSRGVW